MPRQAADSAPERERPIEGGQSQETEALVDVQDLLHGVKPLEAMTRAFEAYETILADLRPRWERNYYALRNEHFANSKYREAKFKPRSKLFRPKTRSALRKNLATAAAALFSTDDVVSVSAEYEDEPRYLASAAVLNHMLNYRLDRTSTRAGVPWFLIAIGSAFTAQATGICISKQYWEFEEAVTGMDPVMGPAIDPMSGMPITDLMTGQPKMQPMTDPETGEPEMQPRTTVVKDRPMSTTIPPENVVCDVNAPWYDVAQGGAYWGVLYPMTVSEFRQMTDQKASKMQVEWLDLPDALLTAAVDDATRASIRTSRDGKQDSRSDMGGNQQQVSIEHKTLWAVENFMRIRGVDLHWWSISTRAYASTVRPTIDVYPEMGGQRPYTMGVSVVEPHTTIPMSPIESWQPLQSEMNDIVNLRLDAVKQAVEPIAKIRQGSMFDSRQLRDRGAPGATVVVRSMEDLEFDRWPGPDGSAYGEMNYLNADFDDLAGVFSGSSVQTNRTLNETVGGMRLLGAAANSLTEYDLRVWVETWVEPTLRQILRLEQAYESDDLVLKVAGQRAQLAKFGIDKLDEGDLAQECCLRVNVGIGAADPNQGLMKLGMAFDLLGKVAPFADRDVSANMEEVVREVMGKAGYRDGMRFVQMGEPGQKAKTADQVAAEMQAASDAAKLKTDETIATQDNQTRLQIEQLKGQIIMQKEQMEQAFDKQKMLFEGMLQRALQGEQAREARQESGRQFVRGSIEKGADRKMARDEGEQSRRQKAADRTANVFVKTRPPPPKVK